MPSRIHTVLDSISLTASLIVVLGVIRAHMLKARGEQGRSTASFVYRAAIVTTSDAAVACAGGLLFAMAALTTVGGPSVALSYSHLLFAEFIVLAALANLSIVTVLGRPLTWPWLYYAGWLRNQDARNSIVAALTAEGVLALGAAVLGVEVVHRIVRAALMWLILRINPDQSDLGRGRVRAARGQPATGVPRAQATRSRRARVLLPGDGIPEIAAPICPGGTSVHRAGRHAAERHRPVGLRDSVTRARLSAAAQRRVLCDGVGRLAIHRRIRLGLDLHA
jgi:hypothetical protein